MWREEFGQTCGQPGNRCSLPACHRLFLSLPCRVCSFQTPQVLTPVQRHLSHVLTWKSLSAAPENLQTEGETCLPTQVFYLLKIIL